MTLTDRVREIPGKTFRMTVCLPMSFRMRRQCHVGFVPPAWVRLSGTRVRRRAAQWKSKKP